VSEKNDARVFFDSYFAVRFVAKRYILQATAKVSDEQIGSCLLGTRWYNF